MNYEQAILNYRDIIRDTRRLIKAKRKKATLRSVFEEVANKHSVACRFVENIYYRYRDINTKGYSKKRLANRTKEHREKNRYSGNFCCECGVQIWGIVKYSNFITSQPVCNGCYAEQRGSKYGNFYRRLKDDYREGCGEGCNISA